VGMYVDNVLVSKNTGGLLDVLDIDRMEILRGPQGTLYGRNTMGGAVNIVTQKPSDEFEGNIRTTFGDYGQRDLRGTLNIPLLPADSRIGELNFRGSLASIRRDGLIENDFAGAPNKELATKDRLIGLARILWQPTESITFLLSHDKTRIDEVPETYWASLAASFGAGPIVQPYLETQDDRPESVSVNDRHVQDSTVEGSSLTVTWDLSNQMTLTSITATRDLDSFGTADSDGSPVPVIFTRDTQDYTDFTQEFRLTGTSGNLDYSAGLFYMEQEGNIHNETIVFGGAVNQQTFAHFENDNWAVYAQGTYAVTERLSLTAGMRYTEEDQLMEKNTPTTEFPDGVGDFNNTSWLTSVGYDWSDNILTYFKVSTGFQAGGFNVREADPTTFTEGVDEETLVAYEAGIKSTFFDKRIRLNAALWLSDYDDKAVNVFVPETLGNKRTNAGTVEIKGLELELLALLTENIQLGFDWGHTDPEFVEYNTFDETGAVVDLSDVSNFAYTPKNTYHGFIDFQFPISELGVLIARLDGSYKSEMNFAINSPEPNSLDAKTLWDVRLTLDSIAGPADSTISVSAWVKNITDESYWTTGVNLLGTLGLAINTYGEPRTFGLDFAVEF